MPLVIDIASNPRLTQMVGRLEEARRAADHAEDRASLDDEIARMYREIGRYVHWLMRQEPDTVRRILDEGRKWAATYDARAGIEALEMDIVEDIAFEEVAEPIEDEADEVSVLELTNDSEASQVDVRLLDAAAQGDMYRAPMRVAPRRSGPEEVDLSAFDVGGSPETTQPVHKVDLGGRSGWTDALQAMMIDLGSANAKDAAVRIGRVTSRVEARWSKYPAPVQAALVRMVSSRSRALQGRQTPEDEAEIKLALGRLRRFASDRQLPLCSALQPGAGPRTGDWPAEERRARLDLDAALP